MRLAVALPLVVLGMLLLATPALPLGIVLILAGWWVYERAPRRAMAGGEDRLYAVVGLAGAVGAGLVVWQYLAPLLRTLP